MGLFWIESLFYPQAPSDAQYCSGRDIVESRNCAHPDTIAPRNAAKGIPTSDAMVNGFLGFDHMVKTRRSNGIKLGFDLTLVKVKNLGGINRKALVPNFVV